jgi:hypothetical protein
MDYREYMKQIENKLGEVKAADCIDENSWFNVVIRGLSDLSKQGAMELQKETNTAWDKKAYILSLYEAPPTRLLSLEIILASWLGWIMHEKQGETGMLSSTDCWKRIEEAYQFGIALSKKHERP